MGCESSVCAVISRFQVPLVFGAAAAVLVCFCNIFVPWGLGFAVFLRFRLLSTETV